MPLGCQLPCLGQEGWVGDTEAWGRVCEDLWPRGGSHPPRLSCPFHPDGHPRSLCLGMVALLHGGEGAEGGLVTW